MNNNKKLTLTNEIFKDKTVPDFFKSHPMFIKPMQLKKVFPSIGLPNFSDKTNIEKSLTDLKKDGSYVHSLLSTMHHMLYALNDTVSFTADKCQWLYSKEDREKNRALIAENYLFSDIISSLFVAIDPNNTAALDAVVQLTEGKVGLSLPNDILNPSDGKILFRKGEGLFRIFGKIKEKADKAGMLFQALDQVIAFKNFCKENVPNKEFSIKFSSDGTEGAWDLATMSMRGIRSCQRWDGEYPKCLIGSILSKFVGIIYLTSGVSADTNAGYSNLGTKMIRRCVVRYAIDADSKKPCILIDKMYPDFDKDIGAAFMKALQSKTTLPVMYASDLGSKIRHLYSPPEKIREEISDRELSYQDTPLKSRQDLNIHILDSNKEELEKDVKGFCVNLSIFLSRKLESIYANNVKINDELKIIINNIRSNTSFTAFAEDASTYITRSFKQPQSRSFMDSKSYYRKYLLEFLKSRKVIALYAKPHLSIVIDKNTSRALNKDIFIDYIINLTSEFIKSEAKRLIN